MKTRVWWTVITVLFLVIVAMAWILFSTPKPAQAPTTGTGDVSAEPLHTRVIVSSPKPNSSVAKTFTVTGEAPGNWYFEASFPVQVLDAENNKLVGVPAQAQGDWMTTAQVPFSVTVTVDNYTGPATLVLQKDNPSGLPENEDSLSIPIIIQ